MLRTDVSHVSLAHYMLVGIAMVCIGTVLGLGLTVFLQRHPSLWLKRVGLALICGVVMGIGAPWLLGLGVTSVLRFFVLGSSVAFVLAVVQIRN